MMAGMAGVERAEVMLRMTSGPNNGIGFSEIATGIPDVKVEGRHEHLTAVAFDISGALLGIASTDKTATIWDVAAGVPVTTRS